MSIQAQSKTTLSLRFKLLIPLMALITILSILTYSGMQLFLTETIFGVMNEEIATVMEITLECLDANELQALTHNAQYNASAGWPDGMTDSRYWEQQTCLEEAVYYNPRAMIFTYYAVDEDTLAFGLDELATLDPETSTPFGDLITAETDEDYEYMLAGLDDVYAFNELYYDDEYDVSYLGTTAPIKNAAGQTVGGLAVYLEASSVVDDLDTLSIILFITFPIVYALVAAIVLWLTGSATSQLRALKAASSRVAEGDYTPISIKPQVVGDEVSALAGVFNMMLEKVRGREETLKKRVMELEIIIDSEKREKQVSEIVDSDFFKDLKTRAAEMRNKQEQAEKKPKED